ncbi:MAG TPA: ATP-binding protein [Streptosporangiaceae bacterium]
MDSQIPPDRPLWRDNRRSIRFAYAAFLAIPLAALVVMWAFAGATIGAAITGHGQAPQHGTVLIRIAVVNAISLVAVLVAVAGLGWFVRRLIRDLASLETTARQFADQQLPLLAEQLRRGEEVDLDGDLSAPAPTKITEVSQAADALASVQRQAVAAAAGEAGLRSGISQVFVSLARRNQSLLQRQLRQLDELERKAADPSALADLFPLDHLTTRMRRHAEGLIILSGAVPGRAWSNPVPVIDVIRGAIAEVEDYKRVAVVTEAEDLVAGSAVADMIHLLAELIENATLFSPSGTRVEIRAERVGTGFAFEVEDRGLGIARDELEAINERLASPQDFDMANADQLGLFVVGKLAARHAVRVSLRSSPYGGITAVAVVPHSMIAGEPAAPAAVPPAAERPAIAGPGPDLLLALTGRKWSPVSPAGTIFRSPPTAIPAQPSVRPAPPESAPRTPARPIPAAPLPLQGDAIPAERAPVRLDSVRSDSVWPDSVWPDPGRPATGWPNTRPDPDGPGSQPRFSQPGTEPPGGATTGFAAPSAVSPWDVASPSAAAASPPVAASPPRATSPSGAAPPPAAAPPPGTYRPAAASPAAAVTAGTHRGLPRRVRQANLSPHLRGGPASATAPAQVPARTPEQAKSLLASLQDGWERARRADIPEPRPPSSQDPVGQEREEPHEEM